MSAAQSSEFLNLVKQVSVEYHGRFTVTHDGLDTNGITSTIRKIFRADLMKSFSSSFCETAVDHSSPRPKIWTKIRSHLDVKYK